MAFVALAIAGFGYLLTITAATTAVQLEVADTQRGRVMALWSLAFLGTRPFGSLADGAVAEAAGLREAAVMMAAVGLVAAVALAWMLPKRVGKGAMRPATASVPPGAPAGGASAGR